MYRIIIFLLLTSPLQILAQGNGNNKISVQANRPIQFSYNNIEELQQQKVLTNALELKLKVKEYSWNVFASLIADNNSFYNTFNNKLALRLQNYDSYNANISRTEVVLSQTQALLFTQPAVQHSQHFNFYYDVVLYPFTNFVPSGQFNFSIVFTMTRP